MLPRTLVLKKPNSKVGFIAPLPLFGNLLQYSRELFLPVKYFVGPNSDARIFIFVCTKQKFGIPSARPLHNADYARNPVFY